MSYDFAGQSTRFLSSSSPSISSYPTTLSLWFNLSSSASNSQLLNWFTWTNASTYSIVRMVSALSNGRIVTITPLTGTLLIDTTTSFSNDVWNHLCIVLLNTTSRTVYLNGGGSSTITSSANISGMNNIRMGCGIQSTGNSTGTTFGKLSDVALWSTDLNTDEIRSLSKGFSAKKIRPQSLEYYAPLTRDLIEYGGGLTITNNGSTPVTDNQRIYL